MMTSNSDESSKGKSSGETKSSESESKTESANITESSMNKSQVSSKRKQGLPICILCQKRFSNKKELTDCINKKHRRQSPNSCMHCYEDFPSEQEFESSHRQETFQY